MGQRQPSPPLSHSPDHQAVPLAEFRPSRRAMVAAIAVVAAVYIYFLIFAQFGFLQAVLVATAGSETQLRLVLTIMGIGGVGSSAVTAWGMRAERARTWL